MASQDAYQPPPLDDILKTLSRFSSTASLGQTTQFLARPPSATNGSSLVPSANDPRSRPRCLTPEGNAASSVPPGPSVDPSAITAWAPALKYVMSHLSQNTVATSKIKTLIYSQRQHERQWWASREGLIAKQKGRNEGKKKANDLLRLLGSSQDSKLSAKAKAGSETEAETKELEVYDAKVYRALSEMSRAMDVELRNLRVPFFAIKHDLVKLDDERLTKAQSVIEKSSDGQKVALNKEELVALQKRMLSLLEDLFGD